MVVSAFAVARSTSANTDDTFVDALETPRRDIFSLFRRDRNAAPEI